MTSLSSFPAAPKLLSTLCPSSRSYLRNSASTTVSSCNMRPIMAAMRAEWCEPCPAQIAFTQSMNWEGMRDDMRVRGERMGGREDEEG